MNQLTSQQAGGALVFKGTVSEPATVTVGGTPATVTTDNRFEGQADVPEGTGQVDVVATDPSGNVRTSTYEVSQAGAPKTFTYDLNGNMTSDGTRTYEWDAENGLVAVKEGATTVASFTYNSDGIRTSKTAGGVTATFMLDGNSVVEERLSTGGATKHFRGPGIDSLLATELATGNVNYVTRDHLGSIREHVTQSGSLSLRRDYDPWGRSGGAAGYAFTGREWEAEVSLYYYRARFLDPSLARFISEDPAATPEGPANREMGNRYAYVRSNPVRRIDPTGLVSWDCLVTVATVSQGFGAAGIIAECNSECYGGKYLRQRLTGVGAGGSFPVGFPGAITASHIKLYDSYPRPLDISLPGLWTYSAVSAAYGGGYSYVFGLTLGAAFGTVAGPQVGFDLGFLDAYSGGTVATPASWHLCLCGKNSIQSGF